MWRCSSENPKINRNFVALLTFAALAGCLALMLHAGVKMFETIGPSRATVAADGRLLLLSHGKIHVFGIDGTRQQVVDLAAIGAPPRPSDFEVHRDGRILVTNPDAPELLRCTLPQGPCDRIPVALRHLPGQEVLPLNAAKVHIDDVGERYFISDNAGHRILVTDFKGTLLHSTRERLVRHPNQLSLLAADRLAVVDTDNRRMAVFELRAGEAPRLVDSNSLRAAGTVRNGRSWPFDSVRLPKGEVAVLIAAMAMKDSDLVIFGADGKAIRRAELTEDADPFDIELWRDRIWIADASRYRFESVALDGTGRRPIEDVAFVRELEAEREIPRRWSQVRRAAQIGLVAIPLLGALLLWRLAEPAIARRAEAAPTQGPTRWLALNPVVKKRARRIYLPVAWGMLGLVAGMLAYLMLRYRDLAFSATGMHYMLPMFAVMAVIGAFFFAALRWTLASLEALRLGASAEHLHLTVMSPWVFAPVLADRQPWSQVYYDGVRILAGRHLIVIRMPLGALFDPGELEGFFQPHLPAENRIAPRELTARAWKAGAFRSMIVAYAVAMIVGLAGIALVRAL